MTLSDHARVRMQQRRIHTNDIDMTLAYGRAVFQGTGSIVYIIGHNEVARYQHQVDLRHLNGLHVVCSLDYVVVTTYRNRSFKEKDLIPSYRRRK